MCCAAPLSTRDTDGRSSEKGVPVFLGARDGAVRDAVQVSEIERRASALASRGWERRNEKWLYSPAAFI